MTYSRFTPGSCCGCQTLIIGDDCPECDDDTALAEYFVTVAGVGDLDPASACEDCPAIDGKYSVTQIVGNACAYQKDYSIDVCSSPILFRLIRVKLQFSGTATPSVVVLAELEFRRGLVGTAGVVYRAEIAGDKINCISDVNGLSLSYVPGADDPFNIDPEELCDFTGSTATVSTT